MGAHVPARPLIVALAACAVALAATAAPAAAKCCTVSYSGGVATVSGTFRLPDGATLIHVGMDPPVGACAARGTRGRISVSKKLKLSRTVRGYYRFVYMYRKDGELVDGQTRRVLVKGKLPAED